jgi:hypothetical protein
MTCSTLSERPSYIGVEVFIARIKREEKASRNRSLSASAVFVFTTNVGLAGFDKVSATALALA